MDSLMASLLSFGSSEELGTRFVDAGTGVGVGLAAFFGD